MTSIVTAVAAGVLVIGLLFAFASLTRTLRALRETIEELRRETLPLVAELRQTVNRAHAELERVDTVMRSAESITSTVDSASRLAYLAFSNPVVKVLAFGAGTSRALKRFRG